MAQDKFWNSALEFTRNHPNQVIQFHKDEKCELDPREMKGKGLFYRGYWDSGMIDNQSLFWFPLGVRFTFPRVLPDQHVPASERHGFTLFDLSILFS